MLRTHSSWGQAKVLSQLQPGENGQAKVLTVAHWWGGAGFYTSITQHSSLYNLALQSTLCALIDGPLSVFGHAVRGDTLQGIQRRWHLAAGALFPDVTDQRQADR